jgi:NADP-dependent 3-hydroxy acid dehydrogenase YdfG
VAQRLRGTAALITGASSGIGCATARALAGEGAEVALVARRGDRLRELAAQLRRDGRRALAVEADVTERAQASAAVQRAVEGLGRLDLVVNSAGLMLNGPVENAPLEEWDRMVALNVLGLLYVSHAALPHLLRCAERPPRRVSDLINISSIAGRKANLGSGVYNLTKFGLGAFSESLRQEVTNRNVRVAVIEPGAVATELFDHNRPEIQEMMAQRLADFERLQAADIADAITYVVTRPRHVAVNELLVRPTGQVL